MPETAIRLKDAIFTYPQSGFKVICEDLSLNTDETALVTGKNGSGKTTLLKLCCGILRPESGTLFIFGEDANKQSLGKIGQNVGYLFQEPSRQLFAATVWDEMTFIGGILGEDPEAIKERAESLLRRFNMLDMRERSVYRLSRGEKQRLAIAAILMRKIRYLILDEPTTGLDGENKKALIEVIESLQNDGIGIAIISHDRGIINCCGQKRIHVEGGRVVQ
ncbi:MAG: Energy-coupling factor transporter ATP-binding protein EcfA1 [Firmicutes bacterium ADurb.Bin182]|nr:MAG: Energy-coupling factor transporter ATP-binding protein EcfA1 [Firmicutes bacterium ADurb.Bin182]